METTPSAVTTAVLVSIGVWLLIVLVILAAGNFHPALRKCRSQMISKWKPALFITVIYILGRSVGGVPLLDLTAISIFCQAMLGLAIAAGIEGYEPLPVTNAIKQHHYAVRQVILMLALSVLMAGLALLLGSIGLDFARRVFGETNYTMTAANTLSSMAPNKWSVFFLFLSGAGIGEETPFRLVFLSFIWSVTRRRWLAVVLSALIFGAYHLTPLNSMYLVNWQFPVSHFVAGTLIGLVWGYLFTRRGYETVVLGHTLTNWIPAILFPV
jgi:membrane protease YdiL (CAAX protease family)